METQGQQNLTRVILITLVLYLITTVVGGFILSGLGGSINFPFEVGSWWPIILGPLLSLVSGFRALFVYPMQTLPVLAAIIFLVSKRRSLAVTLTVIILTALWWQFCGFAIFTIPV